MEIKLPNISFDIIARDVTNYSQRDEGRPGSPFQQAFQPELQVSCEVPGERGYGNEETYVINHVLWSSGRTYLTENAAVQAGFEQLVARLELLFA